MRTISDFLLITSFILSIRNVSSASNLIYLLTGCFKSRWALLHTSSSSILNISVMIPGYPMCFYAEWCLIMRALTAIRSHCSSTFRRKLLRFSGVSRASLTNSNYFKESSKREAISSYSEIVSLIGKAALSEVSESKRVLCWWAALWST